VAFLVAPHALRPVLFGEAHPVFASVVSNKNLSQKEFVTAYAFTLQSEQHASVATTLQPSPTSAWTA
jgi:hypothetical protein